MHISEEEFLGSMLRSKLGPQYWERSLRMFRDYGPTFGPKVANALFHAAEQGKAAQVLQLLEEHYMTGLRFQTLSIRRTVKDSVLRAQTEHLFHRICREVLELGPADSL